LAVSTGDLGRGFGRWEESRGIEDFKLFMSDEADVKFVKDIPSRRYAGLSSSACGSIGSDKAFHGGVR
jgi:hypothetical protein